ncbi:MAG: hypothetical protein GXY44_01605 [Phycisphaerales bacterium]|nr:hypothetical protein [Phycisphaerales bacterium]
MNKQRTKVMIGVVMSGILLSGGYAYAQGVGNLVTLPSVFPLDEGGGGWTIGTYPVMRDPDGPAWIKTLTGADGQSIVAEPGQIFHLIENLIVCPSLGWTDWHEQILTPGWDWVWQEPVPPLFYVNGQPAPGLVMVHTPGNGSVGGSVDFYFDELPPGTQVSIRKTLQYNDTTGALFVGHVQIKEYPTPEPATLGFLALSGLVFLRRARV